MIDANGYWIDTAPIVNMALWKQVKQGPRPNGSIQLGPEATDESKPIDELGPDVGDGIDDDPSVT